MVVIRSRSFFLILIEDQNGLLGRGRHRGSSKSHLVYLGWRWQFSAGLQGCPLPGRTPQPVPLHLDESLLRRLAAPSELRSVLGSTYSHIEQASLAGACTAASPSVLRLSSATVQAAAAHLPALMLRGEDGVAGFVIETVASSSSGGADVERQELDGLVILCDPDSGRVLATAPLLPLMQAFEAACLDAALRRLAKPAAGVAFSPAGPANRQISIGFPACHLAEADVIVCRGVEAIRRVLTSVPESSLDCGDRSWLVFLTKNPPDEFSVSDMDHPALSKAALIRAAALFKDADVEVLDGPAVVLVDRPGQLVWLAMCKYALEKYLSTEAR